jgi:glycosyltransferase involved in cell wall biosynthesis
MENQGLRKKVLLVTRPICPPWDEASKNFAYTLAKSIADFDFFLLTCGLIPGLPENVHQKPIYTSGHLSYLQKARLLKLRKLLRKNAFDIIHYMLTPAKLNVFSFRTFVKTKTAKVIQTIATLREDLFTDAEIKKLIFGDMIITYSKYAKDKLEKLGFKNVEQIYPGIDLELYSPAPKNISLMQQLGINFDDFIISYSGEYTRLGAAEDLLNMALQYINIWKQNKIKILFACRVKNKKDFEKRETMKNTAKEKGLEKYVLFTDHAFTTMEKIYNLSDIVLFTVRDMRGKFDVPLAVVEAMACAKPVIISDIPILQEFTNSQNSVKIGSGDPKKLMESVLNLYQNKEKRETIGKNAREFTEANFDIKKIAEKYKEVYKKL